MRNYQAENVDEYIASSPEDAQAKLKELRTVIKSAIPEIEESISWGIPFYKHHGFLAGMSAFSHHVSFGFTTRLSPEDRKELEDLGYKTGLKVIQIRFDQVVPVATIQQFIKNKAKTNLAKYSNSH